MATRAAMLIRLLPLLLPQLVTPIGAQQHAAHRDHAVQQPAARLMPQQPLIPDVRVMTTRGVPVGLRDLFATDRPLLVNFIFTSCTTICPVMSAAFAQVHRTLPDPASVRLVSISIDPDVDTVPVLAAYAARFGSLPSWELVTGRRQDIEAIARAFGAFRGDRNNHVPDTYIRRSARSPWEVVSGLSSASVLIDALAAAPIVDHQRDELSEAGARLYLRGIGVDGEGRPARVQSDVVIDSSEMPCANCHRRSGWGTAEGPLAVPPVVGSVTFAPRARGSAEMGTLTTRGAGTRPAYTEATLLTALRDGIDPSGRLLSPTMPRYAITADDVAALARHLASLSAAGPFGVHAGTIELATIVAGDVTPAERASMLDVLRTFVQHKNAGTRAESRRRERGPWDMRPHYENYRTWVLHEWVLDGPPAGWAQQLAAHYARHPVFAVVSGIARADWTPIHAFCESHGVPCVLPNTPVVPGTVAGDGFYSLFFSRGIAAEADTLAAELNADSSVRRVTQLARCGTVGELAMTLAARLVQKNRTPRGPCLPATVHLDAERWREYVSTDVDTLVLWLDGADLTALAGLGNAITVPERIRRVYLSGTLVGDADVHLPSGLAGIALLLDPFVSRSDFDRHAWRALAWLKANGIGASDRRVAVNTLFAATLVGEALTHPRTLDSRDYFVERIEHMASRSPMPSAYVSVQLGARRRFGSLACNVRPWPREEEQ
jgi:cytochrome oxidase Cu insertion factor (SCO1/SenC/PrrC family)